MKRILIVDDEEVILFAFSRVLRQNGTEIDTAQSEEDAASLLTANHYDAVVADLRLTGVDDMDGLNVVQRARETHPECKIIVMTAFGGENIRQQSFGRGANFYLEKPVSASKMKEVLISMGVLER